MNLQQHNGRWTLRDELGHELAWTEDADMAFKIMTALAKLALIRRLQCYCRN